jgi:hypothetical protein
MFKNLNSDIDTKAGHMRSGGVFIEAHLANLFKKKYEDEGFYSGEEEELTDEEHSEPAREKEGKDEELRRRESETSKTTQNIEVSTVILPIDLVLRNQSNPSHQSI